MGHSVRRWRDELRSIEKQLPLYYQKISELERRQKELKTLLEEEDKGKEKEKPPAAQTAMQLSKPRYAQLSLPSPRPYAKEAASAKESNADKSSSPLAVLAKDNVIGVLGDVNNKLRFLNQVVYKAVSNVETLMVIINFLEQSGGDLQKQLMSIADQVRTQMENPVTADSASEGGESTGQSSTNFNISPEMISEIMKSPLFHQLAAQFAPGSDQQV